MAAQAARLGPKDRIKRLQAGDASVWEGLVSEGHARVYNLLLRLTGDREEAADLTQEAFVAAYASAATYRGLSAPLTWVCGIAVNCLRSRRRQTDSVGPMVDLPDDLPDPAPTVEELVELQARNGALRAAVERLPEPYRGTVALHYFAGIPSAEIAAQEAVAEATIRWRLHKGVKQLWLLVRAEMEKEDAG